MIPSFKYLPDYLSASELRKHFSDLLNFLDNNDNLNLDIAAESLRDLADRQWHTYELIDPELAVRIERWIVKNWSLTSRKFVVRTLFVIGSLGLKESYELIKESRNQKMSMEIRDHIEKFIMQIEMDGNHIEDPYFSMKGGRKIL